MKFFFYITLGVSMILGGVYISYLFYGLTESDYSIDKFIDNFENHEFEILELTDYYNSKVPKNKKISFGLEEGEQFYIAITSYEPITRKRIYPIIKKSNLKLNSPQTDSVLIVLGWTNETVNELIKRIKNSDVLNLMSGNPTRITHKKDGFDIYSYLIFEEALTDSLKNHYSTKRGDIIYRDNVILRYRSSF